MATAQPLWQLAHRNPAQNLPAVREVVKGFRHSELLVRASAIAFRTLFSLIPFALFVLALAGTLSLDSLWTQDIAPDIAPKVSPSVYDILNTTAITVLGSAQLFWMTAGFALALWELSGAVRAVMVSLNRIYETRDHRSVAARFATSAWLALAAGACVVGAAAALHLGALLVGGALGAIVRYLVAAALLWLGVGLLVRFAPAAPQPLGWVSFGTTLVVVGWLVTWTVYGFYLTHLANAGSVFGAFAAVMVLLTFLQLSATVLLAGALVDALVRKAVTGDRQGT